MSIEQNLLVCVIALGVYGIMMSAVSKPKATEDKE